MARIKRFFSQFGITLLLVVLCLYLILQLTLGIGEVADVEQTTYVTVRDTVQLEAYLFRDETPLYSGTEGIDCFLVDNGDRVAKGTPVAVTYTEEQDATLQERITRINRMIRIEKRYEPRPDHTAVYEKMYGLFRRLYPTLQDMYFELNG